MGKWPLTFILFLFILLAASYSLTVPIFEAPDEVEHFFYVQHIAENWNLPVQDPARRELWGQEGGQPPLFYFLAAPLISCADGDEAAGLLNYNPHAKIGLPLAHGNKNIIIHTEDEAFPPRGAVLAVHLGRLVNVLLGALAVSSTYFIAREIFPRRKALALGAAAIGAFIPQFIFMSGAISNDVLAAAISGWALLLILRLIIRGASARRLVALGVLLGLGALAKLGCLGLLPLAVLALLWRARKEKDWQGFIGKVALFFGPAFVISGWWYARNVLLYGDPFGLRVFLDIVSRREDFSWRAFWYEMGGLRISFWALFGWFNVPMPEIFYRFYDALSLAGAAGLILFFIKSLRSREKESQPSLLAFLVFWVLIVFAGLARWTWLTTGSQGRLLFPAAPAIAVLLACGLGHFPLRRWLLGLAATAMFVVAALAPFLAIVPAYARPPILSLEKIPASVARLNIDYGGAMRLLGYELLERKVRRGEYLSLRLCWQSLAEMEKNYSIYIHLFGRDDEPIGSEDTYPGLGAYPTSLWRPGEIICDTYKVLVDPQAKAPTLCRIDVGIYDLMTMKPLPAYDAQGREVARPALPPAKITTWAAPHYEVSNPVDFDLGGKARLIGHKLEQSEGTLEVSLYWKAQRQMEEDYTVFVHLLDGEGNLCAQHDSQPLNGYLPTSWWDVDEVIKDVHILEAPPGKYRLVVGMYRLSDGERLPLLEEGGRAIDDKIDLGEVNHGGHGRHGKIGRR